MISKSDIISDFQRFFQEKRGYIPGTSGETWTKEKQERLAADNEKVAKYGSQWIGRKVDDCSGAFVDAYRKHGMSIYHGSNRIAREYVEEIVPISEAKAGYAAFKIRKHGEAEYALPDDYRKGGSHYNGDLNDYYHIGLIDDDGKCVINAQSTSKGFTRTDLNLWHCAARLRAVDYGEAESDEGSQNFDEEPLYLAAVTADSGNTVRMRKGPSENTSIIKEIKIGEEVEVMDVLDGWSKIAYEGITGYMMSKFLAPIGDHNTNGDVPFDDSVAIVSKKEMEQILNAIEREMAFLNDIKQKISNMAEG